MTAAILDILNKSTLPMAVRDIRLRLRKHELVLSEYELLRSLLHLQQDQRVRYERGKWLLTGSPEPERTATQEAAEKSVRLPFLSPLGRKILEQGIGGPSAIEVSLVPERQAAPTEVAAPILFEPAGPWGTFRRLLKYYKDCVRNEEGADALAYIDQAFPRFLYLRRSGLWYPHAGTSWRLSIPIDAALTPFLKELNNAGEGGILVLGYPVQAIYIQREGEPETGLIQPIFQYVLQWDYSQGHLVATTENARPELNLKWLEFTFKKRESQRNFLSACGFLNRPRAIDETFGWEKGETDPGLDNLATALSAFLGDRIKEPLHLHAIKDSTIRLPFETGIYNRAVLMLGRRTQYTKSLLNELTMIERASDEELNSTALRYVFAKHEQEDVKRDDLVHEAVVIDTNVLNAEQRQAVSSLLTHALSVVTGPPGTGKSEVVSSTVGNSRLKGSSVLFASRNHKAIEAVVDRLKAEDGRSLIIRANSNEDPSFTYTFEHALKDILTEPYDHGAQENFLRLIEELENLLADRGDKGTVAKNILSFQDRLGELEQKLSYLAIQLPREIAAQLDETTQCFPCRDIERLAVVVKALRKSSSQFPFFWKATAIIKVLALVPFLLRARWKLRNFSGFPKVSVFYSPKVLKALSPDLIMLVQAKDYALIRQNVASLAAKVKKLPPLEEVTATIDEITKRISTVAPKALELHLSSRSGLSPSQDREELAALRAALRTVRGGLMDDKENRLAQKTLRERLPMLLEHFPCWAVTNLSVGSRLPLVAGMFDLAIIDEASQSDIPSAIPILFRARRAAVVGDPFQLTHISKLSVAKDSLLRRRMGLRKLEDFRYSYTQYSIYDLFAQTNKVVPIFLSETYRSVEDIAEYSNVTFYDGRLRVATDVSRLRVPPGLSSGIHWSHIVGEVKSGGGSGCYCREEVEVVVAFVRRLLIDHNFRGTIGIVTPFRQQANRIRDALLEGDILGWQTIDAARLIVDTAHGFQGDERDVIIFSLCAGPDMPAGSAGFLRETANLFNVAVSRARAVLHVFGNYEWARRCGIKHIQNLAHPRQRRAYTPQPTPWHPHESPWEKILYEAMLAVELQPIPQYPVIGRRLDLALIKEGDSPLKLDIEVDGDRCHRNPNGSRKLDDHWRDIQMTGIGWEVMRFWVYQLREDLDGCVSKILEKWGEHGSANT